MSEALACTAVFAAVTVYVVTQVVMTLRRARVIETRCKARIAMIENMDELLVPRLLEYAKRLQVPVLLCAAESLRDWRTNTSACGTATRTRFGYEIRIREDKSKSPWVLGHELGHIASWQAGGSSSEAEANCEAEKIMLAVLTASERAVLGPIITAVKRAPAVLAAASVAEQESLDLARRYGPRRR